ETGGDSGDRRALGDFALELRLAEAPHEVVGLDFDRRSVAVLLPRDVQRGPAAKLLDLAIELPHAGFARVVAHDGFESGVGEDELAVRDAVLLRALLDEVPTCNLHL